MEKRGKRLLGNILKLPLIILAIAAFIAGIVASIMKIQGINYVTPLILGLIIFLYILGEIMLKKNAG